MIFIHSGNKYQQITENEIIGDINFLGSFEKTIIGNKMAGLTDAELRTLCKVTSNLHDDGVDCRSSRRSLINYLVARGVVDERDHGVVIQIASPGVGLDSDLSESPSSPSRSPNYNKRDEITPPPGFTPAPTKSASRRLSPSSPFEIPSPPREELIPLTQKRSPKTSPKITPKTSPKTSPKRSPWQRIDHDNKGIYSKSYQKSLPLARQPLSYYGTKVKELGSGTYGVVNLYEGTHGKYAVKKFLDQNYKTDGVSTSALRELSVMRRIDHPHIVPLLDLYLDHGVVSFVMPLAKFDLKKAIDGNLTKKQEEKYAYQLLSAFSYLQANDILHRDLKPQNVLVFADDSIKVTDFGLSRPTGCIYSKGMTKEVYTLWYRPPELLVEDVDSYHISADSWSIGCVLYELFVGRPLFYANDERELLKMILKTLGNDPSQLAKIGSNELDEFSDNYPKTWQFQPKVFDKMGDKKMADLVRSLLRYDPMQRLSAYEVISDPYFDSYREAGVEYEPVPCEDTLRLVEWYPSDRVVNPEVITENKLIILKDWLFAVSRVYKSDKRVYLLTTFLVDWVITRLAITNDKLQLLGVVCHYLASKYHQVYSNELKDYLVIIAGSATADQFLELESTVLQAIEFDLVFSVSYDFFRSHHPESVPIGSARLPGNYADDLRLLLIYGMTYSTLRYQLVPSEQNRLVERIVAVATSEAMFTRAEQKQFEHYRNDLRNLSNVLARNSETQALEALSNKLINGSLVDLLNKL